MFLFFPLISPADLDVRINSEDEAEVEVGMSGSEEEDEDDGYSLREPSEEVNSFNHKQTHPHYAATPHDYNATTTATPWKTFSFG